jgi:hypothetical protein
MKHRAWIAFTALLTCAGAAQSQSMTYDFEGRGEVCTAPQPGADFVCESDVRFTGTVTMDVLDPNPGGPDGELDGEFRAWADNGWVKNGFVIRWGDQSFVPGPVPGMELSESFTEVWNNFAARADEPPTDQLNNSVYYSSDLCIDQASLVRSTTDTAWLDKLEFDLRARLAPGAGATNVLTFDTTSCGTPAVQRYGSIALTALTPRARRVDIDIRPHADPNYINPRSAGFVPVAVLGSAGFDATQVDPRSLRLGPGHARAKGEVRVADVNRDGYPDAVLRFRIRDVGICMKQHTLVLTGRTFSGEPFFGVDQVRIPGK